MLFRSIVRASTLLAVSQGFAARGGPSAFARGLSTMSAAPAPITLVVVVEIEDARLEAFREAMAIDCAGSREEEGCLRFDLLQDAENPNKFVFYEAYVDADAVAKHKTFDHYKAWADFKAAGGVKSQEVIKAAGVDFTY